MLQGNQPSWEVAGMIREPSLAIKLYVIFVLVSILVAAIHLVRSWLILPPFREATPEICRRALYLLQRQTLSLKRWIGLNVLVWAILTVYGSLTVLQGLAAQKSVGLPLVFDLLFDLFQPSELLLCVVIVLYLVRWHILWRAERFNAQG